MSVTIGLISDIHATALPLSEALAIFQQEKVDLILCLGDVAGYGTELEPSIELLVENGCTTIQGNHDVWHLNRHVGKLEMWAETFFQLLPVTWELTVEGKSIFAVHASPPDSMSRGITLLDQNENLIVKAAEDWAIKLAEYDFDVLIVGHTHQVFSEILGHKLVINPGSTTFNHSCAILGLPDLKVKTIPLSGKAIKKVWNWGMMT